MDLFTARSAAIRGLMENGEWRMENAEWRMENGKCGMENAGIRLNVLHC